jgi:uncharacterized protein YjiS (DUF1127 family)
MKTIVNSPPAVPIGLAVASETQFGFVDRLLTWIERARQRRMLASLDERMLKDIGLSRLDVSREVDKAFWQY